MSFLGSKIGAMLSCLADKFKAPEMDAAMREMLAVADTLRWTFPEAKITIAGNKLYIYFPGKYDPMKMRKVEEIIAQIRGESPPMN